MDRSDLIPMIPDGIRVPDQVQPVYGHALTVVWRGQKSIDQLLVGIGGRFVEEGLEALKLGKVEKELEWFPLKGIEFDPTRDTIAE